MEAIKRLYKPACLASSNKRSCRALAERVLDIFNVAAYSHELLVQEGHWERFVQHLGNKLKEMQTFVDSFSSHGEPDSGYCCFHGILQRFGGLVVLLLPCNVSPALQITNALDGMTKQGVSTYVYCQGLLNTASCRDQNYSHIQLFA